MSAAAIARAAAATSWPAAPGPVQDRVVDLVADCVAVAALGSARPELVRLVAAHAPRSPQGDSTVVGSPRGWPASSAGFLNGCAIAADQLQDGHRLARGHPASHVVPAALAVAEERDLAGTELLCAVLAGYEAGVRLGRAMGGTPDGVHDIGTWGQAAVAVAVARLLAPGDADAARRALELSAAAVLLSDAGTVFAGRTGSHAFLGASVQLGTSLGIAAVSGLEAQPGALDRHLAGVAARDWNPERLQDGICAEGRWRRYEVLEGYLKVHPTCAHLHGVNDAVQDLVAAGAAGGGSLRAGDIREVVVHASAGAAMFDAIADSELAARFSVPTSVAIALVTGRLDESTLTEATVTAPAVRELAGRVRVVHDPALDAGYPAGRPARVRMILADGAEVTATADRPRGDADRALDRAALAGKATRLLTRRFGREGAAVLDAVHRLARSGTARDVGVALRAAAQVKA